MKIYLGADHRGFYLKERIEKFLGELGHEVADEGDEKLDPKDDYTVFAARVVNAMKADDEAEPRGILICGSGQGMVIAANRFKGIRAGFGWSVEAARSTRNDEDSNILALPSDLLEDDDNKWQNIVKTWLDTSFSGAERHKRRVNQLDDM